MLGNFKLSRHFTSTHARLFVRTFRQAQRSTGPKCKSSNVLPILSPRLLIDRLAQEGEFRVLQLNTSKTNRNGPLKKRVKPQFKEVRCSTSSGPDCRSIWSSWQILPPRYLRMSTDQDWTNVWPAAATFKQSVVPLPITQGYVASEKENKGLPLEKYGNAELMKIPNFFHLTPNHIKKHCAALKSECVSNRAGFSTNIVLLRILFSVARRIENGWRMWTLFADRNHHLRLSQFDTVVTRFSSTRGEIPSNIDVHSPSSTTWSSLSLVQTESTGVRWTCTRQIRSSRWSEIQSDNERIDTRGRQVSSVHLIDAFGRHRLCHRCPYRKQNYDYAQYLLTALYFESWVRTEICSPEKEKTNVFDVENGGLGEGANEKRLADVLLGRESIACASTRYPQSERGECFDSLTMLLFRWCHHVYLSFQKDASTKQNREKIVEQYRSSISRVQDEGLENELNNLKDYRDNVLALYNLKLK